MVIDRPTAPDKGLDWLYKKFDKFSQLKKMLDTDPATGSREDFPATSHDDAGHEGGGQQDGISSPTHEAVESPKPHDSDTSPEPVRTRDGDVSPAEIDAARANTRNYYAGASAHSYQRLAIARGLSADEASSWMKRFYDAQAAGDRDALKGLRAAFGDRLREERERWIAENLGDVGARTGAARDSNVDSEQAEGAAGGVAKANDREFYAGASAHSYEQLAIARGLPADEASSWMKRFYDAQVAGDRDALRALRAAFGDRLREERERWIAENLGEDGGVAKANDREFYAGASAHSY
ncbi:hypothetical protein, partial [Actinoallomurus spadix]|uniref:hypothetical protein n=1 Tax=Actinoallomurus spadix TaxID=79912 RepID=UPI0031E4923B